MSAAAGITGPHPSNPARSSRLRAGVAALGAVVLGAAPHVLHHAGPLAGAAILAGATGQLLFGALGLIAAAPLLQRLRRRTGSWRAPVAALVAMALIFTASSLVIGPALTDGDGEGSGPGSTQPLPDGHQSHHD